MKAVLYLCRMPLCRDLSLFLCILLFSMGVSLVSAQQKKELTVMFYNTENFFDTLDDPHKTDNEFLPSSPHKWDTRKYFNKIKNLSAVIDSVGGSGADGFPALVGLCEVENEAVIADLVKFSSLKNASYAFKVTNSPDVRSIDVALLYSTKSFQLKQFREISATNPAMPENKTRNILFATFTFNKKETVHVFVNHWPSMRDGEEESEPRRIYAAGQLRRVIDSLTKKDPSSKIIVMGDFNETPGKKAIAGILDARGLTKVEKKDLPLLMNPFADIAETGRGTHYYDKEWNVLDQIMFSGGMHERGGLHYVKGSADIFFNDLVLYTAPRLKIKLPNRTYKGAKYFNGFSDHLAVYLKLQY